MAGVTRHVREMCRRGYEAELAELGLAELLLVDVGGSAKGEVDDAVVFCMHVRLVGGLGRGEVLNETAGSHGEDVEGRCARDMGEGFGRGVDVGVAGDSAGTERRVGENGELFMIPFYTSPNPNRAIPAKESMLEGISAGIEETDVGTRTTRRVALDEAPSNGDAILHVLGSDIQGLTFLSGPSDRYLGPYCMH